MDFSGFADILEDIEEKQETEKEENEKQDINNFSTINRLDEFGDLQSLKEQVFNDIKNTDLVKSKLSNNLNHKNIHSGHRQRARDRFLLNPDDISDYDLLELLLFFIIPRADTKPIAKLLIDKYKNLRNIFNAEIEELNSCGINGNSLKYLFKLTNIFQKRLLQQDLQKINIIDNMSKLIEYCQMSIGSLQHEEMHIIFLNSKFNIISDVKLGNGDITNVFFNMRDILQKCISYKASSIVLYHNHPSGDVSPSDADIENTNKIIEAIKNIDIDIIDHIIIGGNNWISFKQKKLIY